MFHSYYNWEKPSLNTHSHLQAYFCKCRGVPRDSPDFLLIWRNNFINMRGGESIWFQYFLKDCFPKVQRQISHRCPLGSKSKICVHYGDETHASTCKGDSGGPLMMTDGFYGFVIGVVSYGEDPDCSPFDLKCINSKTICSSDNVAVFTKVQFFLPWIRNITGLEGNNYEMSNWNNWHSSKLDFTLFIVN